MKAGTFIFSALNIMPGTCLCHDIRFHLPCCLDSVSLAALNSEIHSETKKGKSPSKQLIRIIWMGFINGSHHRSIKPESLGWWFSKCVMLLTSTTVSPGNLLEMQNLVPSQHLLNQKMWVENSHLFNKHSSWFWYMFKFENKTTALANIRVN